MSVWSKLFREKSATTGAPARGASAPLPQLPEPGRPASLFAIPGKLELAVHAHDAVQGTLGRFLSAVSHGLARYKQRELVFTLRLSDEDDASSKIQELSQLFRIVYNWAREGRRVDAGELTQFGARGLFRRKNNGLLYANARPMPGVDLPTRALAALLVDEQETRLAMAHGAYRVLTRIGELQGHFPYSPWNELARSSVATGRDSESVLSKVTRIRTRGASFVVEPQRVRVLLEPSVKGELLRSVGSLPPGAPFSLLVEPAPSANAVLVWYPGQSEPKVFSESGSDASRLSGSCLVIGSGAKSDRARPLEDGYSLLFCDASWAKVSAALLSGRALAVPMAAGTTLEIEWRADA